MANNCFYELRALGKKQDLDELVAILNYKREKDCYLARIFSADVVDGTESSIDIVGDCAWSVYSCMFGDFNGTYYKEEGENPKGLTTIDRISKDLNLYIEICATEPGMGFAEHYIIDCGLIVESEERDYDEYFYDRNEESFEQFKEDNNLPSYLTEDDFEEGWYSVGAYDFN